MNIKTVGRKKTAPLSRLYMRGATGVAAHIGGRKEQQDKAAVQVEDESALLVVADGMGGHQGGAIASAILVDHACRLHKQMQGRITDPDAFFKQVIRSTWEEIRAYSRKHDTSPHTVGVMALVNRDRMAFWAHIGDCRLYQLHGGDAPVITRDHSVVQMLVLEGEITEEEMADHPDQNKLWRSIGGDKHNDPTIGGSKAPLRPGEILILCSDGLWEQVSPREMLTACSCMPPPEAARHLTRKAAERGGEKGDNVSAAVWLTP